MQTLYISHSFKKYSPNFIRESRYLGRAHASTVSQTRAKCKEQSVVGSCEGGKTWWGQDKKTWKRGGERASALRETGKVKSISGEERAGGRGCRRAQGLPSEWVWQRISALKSTLSGMKAYYSPDISQARAPPYGYELLGQKCHFHACSMVKDIYRSSLDTYCLSVSYLLVSLNVLAFLPSWFLSWLSSKAHFHNTMMSK